MERTIPVRTRDADLSPEPPSRRPRSVPSADPRALLDAVVASLSDNKAEDVSIIDLAGKTTLADFMVIASGRSSRQVAAIAEHLVRALKDSGILPATEGMETANWVIVDAGTVIVHVFRPEVRAFYNLEKMWNAAPHPSRMPAFAPAPVPAWGLESALGA